MLEVIRTTPLGLVTGRDYYMSIVKAKTNAELQFELQGIIRSYNALYPVTVIADFVATRQAGRFERNDDDDEVELLGLVIPPGNSGPLLHEAIVCLLRTYAGWSLFSRHSSARPSPRVRAARAPRSTRGRTSPSRRSSSGPRSGSWRR